MPSNDKPHQPGKTQVPGQFLGFGLQYTRMVSLLLEVSSSAVVSLEVFEDVGAQNGDATLASQTKSSLTNNPVSNRAEPLWKTFGNWLEAIKEGQLPVDTTLFELYVFGDFEGELCNLFSEAQSDLEAKSALLKAKGILSAAPEPLPSYVKNVFNAEEQRVVALIKRFRYRHGSGASVDDLKKQVQESLFVVPPEFIENVLHHAVGWVKCEVDKLLEKKQPAAIAAAAFRKEMTSYIRSVVFFGGLADLAGPAKPSDIGASHSRRYVRQLDLISVGDDRKLRAISAYLRASANRAQWGFLGLVHEFSLDDFEKRLNAYWDNARIQTEILLKDREPAARGQYLLSECMKFDQPLQGSSAPHDFAEGCYHALAEDLKVGWHPDYKTIAKEWD